MKNQFLIGTLLATAIYGTAEEPKIGVVNFGTCITDSKAGLKEQEDLETLRNQFTSMIESTEKELKEISAKFEDTEYLDTLSPQAEEELRSKKEGLQEKLATYQQQIYQMLTQAQYRVMHKMRSTVAAAAEKVAQEQHLHYVINEDACFYVHPDVNVTNLVVSEMDKDFSTSNTSDAQEESDQAGN